MFQPVRPAVPPRLEKARVALTLIDMQDRFRPLIQEGEQVTAACSRLVRFCRTLEIPVLVTEHYPKGLGGTFAELKALVDPCKPFEKIAFSCCGDAGYRAALDDLGRDQRDQMVICGIETHVCVYQTVLDLLHAGWQVAVACDAVTSRTAGDREIGLRRMAEIGAQSMSAEMIMFEILKQAKTEDFQAVASILKE